MLYDYVCPKGHRWRHRCTLEKFRNRRRCPECGEGGRVDVPGQHRDFQKPVNAKWPLKSLALGVIPQQVAEAREKAARYGVPISYSDSGDAIFTSAQNRRDVFRAMKNLGHPRVFDRSGYD